MSDFTYSLPFTLEKYRSGIITTLKRKGHHELAQLLDGCQIQLDERGLSYYYNNTGRWDATAVVILIYVGLDKIDRLDRFPKSMFTRICDELIPADVGFDVKTVEFLPNLQDEGLNKESVLTLPDRQEETLRTLLDDINNALERNQPTLVLDRLHTYSTKLLRHLCEGHGIIVKTLDGEYLPLHSLAGMLKNYYERNRLCQSDFSLRAIKASVSLFEAYNGIRNNQSYAHDNEILDSIEATFVIREIANIITFLDKFESYIKNAPISETSDDDLPF